MTSVVGEVFPQDPRSVETNSGSRDEMTDIRRAIHFLLLCLILPHFHVGSYHTVIVISYYKLKSSYSLVRVINRKGASYAKHGNPCFEQAVVSREPAALHGIEDILAKDDLEIMRANIPAMRSIFKHIDTASFESLVHSYPILLAMKPDELSTAISRLNSQVPYVDPNYMVAEHSAAGIELLMSCRSPIFNLSRQVEETSKVLRIGGVSTFNTTRAFIRRVPHVLNPRYRSRLHDQLLIMRDMLTLKSHSEALGIVKRWPGIIMIAELGPRIELLATALTNLDILPRSATADNAVIASAASDSVSAPAGATLVATGGYQQGMLQLQRDQTSNNQSLHRQPMQEPRTLRSAPKRSHKADHRRKEALTRIIRKEPSLLGVDVVERCAALQAKFPSWHVAKVVDCCPSILTQCSGGTLDLKYQVRVFYLIT